MVRAGSRKWKELSPMCRWSPDRSFTQPPLSEGVCSVPLTVTPFLPSTSSSQCPGKPPAEVSPLSKQTTTTLQLIEQQVQAVLCEDNGLWPDSLRLHNVSWARVLAAAQAGGCLLCLAASALGHCQRVFATQADDHDACHWYTSAIHQRRT